MWKTTTDRCQAQNGSTVNVSIDAHGKIVYTWKRFQGGWIADLFEQKYKIRNKTLKLLHIAFDLKENRSIKRIM